MYSKIYGEWHNSFVESRSRVLVLDVYAKHGHLSQTQKTVVALTCGLRLCANDTYAPLSQSCSPVWALLIYVLIPLLTSLSRMHLEGRDRSHVHKHVYCCGLSLTDEEEQCGRQRLVIGLAIVLVMGKAECRAKVMQ